MAEIKLRDGEIMLVDNDCISLFEGKNLYAIKARNTLYAYCRDGIAHRMILGLTDRKQVVDHLNGDGLDNRRENMRVVSSVENVKNRQRSRSADKALPPGVFKFRNGYMVQVTENYRKIFVGTFNSLGPAVSALNAKRAELGRPAVNW